MRTILFTLLLLALVAAYHWLYATPSRSAAVRTNPASCTTCSANKDRRLAPLMEPEFNMREVTKNMILLEDHLFHDDRRCPDCVRKHCLTIEAYLDEAFSLDKAGKYTEVLESTSRQFKPISESMLVCCSQGLPSAKCVSLGQRLRIVRKGIMNALNK
jgi:hypothetical protein